MQIRGVMATRRVELEAAGIALHPENTFLPCYRCSQECALTPSTVALVEAGALLLCSECVGAVDPDARFVLPPGGADELAVIDRLNGPAGRA